jgi:hypothetical protein
VSTRTPLVSGAAQTRQRSSSRSKLAAPTSTRLGARPGTATGEPKAVGGQNYLTNQSTRTPATAASRTGAATPRAGSRLRGQESATASKVTSGIAARTANRTPLTGVKAPGTAGNISARAGAGSTRPGEVKAGATSGVASAA